MMMLRRSVIVAALALCPTIGMTTVSLAAPIECSQFFPHGSAPDLVNPKLRPRTQALCYSAFAVLHSGITRTPLWAAEHLTRKGLDAAVATLRRDTFHEEPRLPPGERADLDDYARSGFDRGHLAPAADMPDEQAQQESFSLANMIPQDPQSNRGLWSGIESAARGLARKAGELYVVSGPVFQGATLQRLRGRVLVPTHIFKAVYDPKRKQAAAYLVENADGDHWRGVSIAELRQFTGIDPFPGLAPTVKDHAMALPDPKLPGRRQKQTETPWSMDTILDKLMRFMR
ncbi:DNA/RNA non-specific endonuclease (plasmid) [Skermanella rosea]|uniref:DNA/RNA non-specific endonuclease n=1 Tax=Skermanella rosea TaxID=1817965 RepID=UPI001932D259|nr:DNA/RNA non-specific endonuclease [Skermanella rosea]UEM06749.1 DNA/RNA non-specific endonuclease [Skermanella rosea]